MIPFPIKEMKDPIIRRSFELLDTFLNSQTVLKGQWSLVEISFDKLETNFKYKHSLPFIPRDVIQISILGTGVVTWNYDKFDSENLDISTTGKCTVRALIGSSTGV